MTACNNAPMATPIPLWQQLQATASVLMAVRAGQSGTAALAAVDGALRPGVQSLAFRVLRSLGRAEALRQQLASRAPPPQADALLCTALALAAGDGDAPYEAFTLVDQAVEAAKRNTGTAKQASFINACLRRFLRERQQLVEAANRDPVAQWNHPRWWINRLKQDHPSRWQAILRANNLQAPMTLRVNSRMATQQQYLETLAAAGIGAVPVGRQGVVLDKARAVHELPGFDSGVVSVQDAAAQMAAQLLLGGLDLQTSQTNRLQVLDACAAPGGKTAHLLELADCDVTALDIDAQRCARIHETLARLGLHAQVVAADAARPDLWWNGILFDAILLDAPCTASGIVRRHPDVRWLRRETDIAQLAGVQARLLQKLWPLVKPGGRLLYC
ncbi:MAG: 16S rRNA (cytosine(967)-C(5))-methyltransferase RsmB, partial [Burkholderiaceae bacterium]|nr:16S rRNA (cytosine(967)-C(5))-methyltransferase RsmB [Burkholderiaceae bacterium]